MAIKLLRLGERFQPKYVERELRNHRRLVHPHIVAFKEVFVTPQVGDGAAPLRCGGGAGR